MIKIDKLTYIYMPGTPYAKKALNDISIEIKEGEFTGIIGQTGSGKSTLVQHFNGLLKPASGSVIIDGENVANKNLKELRRKVGLVFQYPEHQLFEETVYKDIAFGLVKQSIPEDEIKVRVQAAIRAVDMDIPGILDKSPFELSGGQKRRIAIAGVIVMKPKVLVLDEPAAGLDPKGREDIYKMIGAMHQGGDVTVVLVSHNMEDIARYAQRVLVMNEGKIVMEGHTTEIFSKRKILAEIGLDVPSISRLMYGLNKVCPQISSGIYTVEDAKSEILKVLGVNPWKEGSRFRC